MCIPTMSQRNNFRPWPSTVDSGHGHDAMMRACLSASSRSAPEAWARKARQMTNARVLMPDEAVSSHVPAPHFDAITRSTFPTENRPGSGCRPSATFGFPCLGAPREKPVGHRSQVGRGDGTMDALLISGRKSLAPSQGQKATVLVELSFPQGFVLNGSMRFLKVAHMKKRRFELASES